jgi:hypothetical protein
MSHTLSFTELDAQQVELLPARTVMSMFTLGGGKGPVDNHQAANNTSHAGNGGTAIAVNAGNINFGGDQNNVAVASANGGNSNAQQLAWQHYVGGNGANHQVANNTSTAGNGGIAVAVNAGNINFGGDQNNVAVASANGGNSNAQQFVHQSYKH